MTLICLLVFLSSCMSFELEGDGLLTNDSCNGSETVHGSLYGFKWAQHDVEKCYDGLGIYRVEYQTNIFFIVASVCSLGLYVPQTVEWWCQAPESNEEDGPLLGGPDNDIK